MLSQLQTGDSVPGVSRVVGVWTIRPHPVPFLPAFTLIHISVRHFRDWTANVALAGMTNFFFCPRYVLYFSCHFSSSFQDKAEFLEQILVSRRGHTLCACCVQLPLCARPIHPWPVGVRCSGRAPRQGERGCAIIRYRSHIDTSGQQTAVTAKYHTQGWDSSRLP